MKKALLILFLCLSFIDNSQSLFDPQLFSLDDGKHTERKILKVSNDSVYILYPNFVHFNKATISLCNLNSGKVLKEVTINDDLFYTVPGSPNQAYEIRIENNKLIVFVFEKNKDEYVVHKHIINPDLTITRSEKVFKFSWPRTKGFKFFDVSMKENFYLFTFFDYQIAKPLRNQNTMYFSLVSLDKNLNLLDSFSYIFHKSKRTSFKKPDHYNNYGILHQLNFGGNEECIAEKMIFSADKKGKINRFRSAQLMNYDNFIFDKDSAGKTYGYCFNYAKPVKKEVEMRLVKFCVDFTNNKFEVLNANMVTEKLRARNLLNIQTQAHIKNNKLYLFVSTISLEANNIFVWKSRFANYFIFENDTLQTTHYLSLNNFSTNPERSLSFPQTVPLGNSVFMCYNDNDENSGYNTITPTAPPDELRLDVFGKSRPAVFLLSAGGHLQSNYTINKDEKVSFLEPDGLYNGDDEAVYIPYCNNKKGETKIIKIKAATE